MNIPFSNLLNNFFIQLFVLSIYFLFYIGDVKNYYTLIIWMPLIIVTVISLITTSNKYKFSLATTHWFFILMFYCFAGFFQSSQEQYIRFNFNLYYMIDGVVVLLLWSIFFSLGYLIKIKNVEQKYIFKPNKKFEYLAIFILSILACIFIAYSGSITNIFYRETNILSFSQTQSSSLLFGGIIRNLTAYLSIFVIYSEMEFLRKNYFIIVYSLLILLLTNFPTGIARYNVGILYLGSILLFFNVFKIYKLFVPILIFGNFVIFQLLNAFRCIDSNIKIDILHTFYEMHYDAFSMILHSLQYIEIHSISFGRQLIGNLLFFIPRQFWENKSIGSGHTILRELGYSFTNQSMPIQGEGLINFGYLGVIIFAFIFGVLLKYLDTSYWSSNKKGYLYFLYHFLIGLFFFIFRGDLMSTLSYGICHIICFSFVFYLNIITQKYINNKNYDKKTHDNHISLKLF